MTARTRSRILPNVRGTDSPIIASGSGVWMTDTNGVTYLDGCSGAVVSNIGHGVAEIADAINAQLRSCEFAYRGQFTTEPAEQLADTLCELAGPSAARVFFGSSGSEAVETAIKLAVQYWVEVGQPQRSMVIGAGVSYHGATASALGASGAPIRRAAFEGLLVKRPSFAPPTCSRCPVGQTKGACKLECLTSLETVLTANPDTVAAVIIEPVGGATKASDEPPVGYLRAMREICDRFDVLLICDEVMTGAWRTGPFIAQHAEGMSADLTVLAKGLAAGYSPISAVLINERIDNAIEQGSGLFAHGYTHAANPTSAAAANAVIAYCLAHDVPANVVARAAQLRDGLERLAATHPVVRNVRGRGLLMGLELADPATDLPLFGGVGGSNAITRLAQECGLIIYPCAALDVSSVMVAPPLTITADEVDELLTRLDAALTKAASLLSPEVHR
jgi:adenosylmethionine-8-amino-7-oxononanoate aminotransferase